MEEENAFTPLPKKRRRTTKTTILGRIEADVHFGKLQAGKKRGGARGDLFSASEEERIT